jgi:hypothetical protein
MGGRKQLLFYGCFNLPGNCSYIGEIENGLMHCGDSKLGTFTNKNGVSLEGKF